MFVDLPSGIKTEIHNIAGALLLLIDLFPIELGPKLYVLLVEFPAQLDFDGISLPKFVRLVEVNFLF